MSRFPSFALDSSSFSLAQLSRSSSSFTTEKGAGGGGGGGEGGGERRGGSYKSLLLHNRNYLLLWISLCLSLCGDWFNYIAAISLLSEIVGEDSVIWATAGFIVVRLAPPLLFLPLITWWTHRFNHLQTMILSTLFRSLVVIFFIIANTEKNVPLIYCLAFIEYIAAGFYDPARRSLLPRIVPEEDMALAAIIDGMTYSCMMAFGSAIGGFLTNWIGINACFLIDSLSYTAATTLSILVWVSLSSAHSSLTDPGKKESSCILRDVEYEQTNETESQEPIDSSKQFLNLIRGIASKFSVENPLLIVSCFCKMSAAVGWGVTNVIVISFSQNNWVLGTNGTVSLGILLAIRGVSELIVPMICESIFVPIIGRQGRKGNIYFRLVLFGFFLEFVGTVMQSLSFTDVPVLMLVLFIIGNFVRCAGDANVWCFSSAFLTVWLPFNLMGPVFSVENSLYVMGEILGTLLGAVFEANVGLPFLPSLETGYSKTVAFLVFIWTMFIFALFHTMYNHWKFRETRTEDQLSSAVEPESIS